MKATQAGVVILSFWPEGGSGLLWDVLSSAFLAQSRCSDGFPVRSGLWKQILRDQVGW